jgi:hypothetical protein
MLFVQAQVVTSANEINVWSFSKTYDEGFHTLSWDMIKEPSRTEKSAYFRGTIFHKEGDYNVTLKTETVVLNEDLIIKPFLKKN